MDTSGLPTPGLPTPGLPPSNPALGVAPTPAITPVSYTNPLFRSNAGANRPSKAQKRKEKKRRLSDMMNRQQPHNQHNQHNQQPRTKTPGQIQIEADKQAEMEMKKKISDETGVDAEDDVDDEGDTMQFENYESSFKLGKAHPSILVQAASLASVPVPVITYKHKLPKSVITGGLLSNPQMETVLLACQKHEEMFRTFNQLGEMTEFRKGFYIGGTYTPYNNNNTRTNINTTTTT